MPYFMITWIITNVSVCIFPIDIMPHVFRYGYGAPFYNVNRAMRTVIFNTKNQVGLNFGVLLVWVAISCVTLAGFQVLVRRKGPSGAAAGARDEVTGDGETGTRKETAEVHTEDVRADEKQTA